MKMTCVKTGNERLAMETRKGCAGSDEENWSSILNKSLTILFEIIFTTHRWRIRNNKRPAGDLPG